MNNELFWVWLENIKGFGSIKIRLLLDYFDDPKTLYYALDEEVLGVLNHHKEFKKEDVREFFKSKDKNKIKKIYQMIIASSISFTTIESLDYPNKLKNIYDPPNVIYYKGKMKDEQEISIAVVGARRCSVYGKNVAGKIAEELASKGVHIVSGMARGIDTFAHEGALRGGGKTTAVLGSGVNICYPKENKRLMESIINNGCVISEVPINASPIAGNFPRRNRIISGLSDGVLIVEAAKKSGSLITADCALEQGKDVFVIPGRITDKYCEGTNALLKMGAKPITSVDDILEEYNLKKASILKHVPELNPVEERVYSEIEFDPTSVEKISKKSGILLKDLQIILLKLELKGIVCRVNNNMIVRL